MRGTENSVSLFILDHLILTLQKFIIIMAAFTKQKIKKLIISGSNSKQIHQEYLDSALKLPRESKRLSDNDDRRDETIKKLRENGFTEISGDVLEKYMKLYSRHYYMREGLVMCKEGHTLWANVLKSHKWNEPIIKLFDIDRYDDFSLCADSAEQTIDAVNKFEAVEEEWKNKWSIEESKIRKSMEINQNTLDMVLQGIVKKHKWEYSIEKDSDGRSTLLVRLSGRRQISMKFKKDVSTEVITKVADVISQLVNIIKDNDDIDIMVRGISFHTKWQKPE